MNVSCYGVMNSVGLGSGSDRKIWPDPTSNAKRYVAVVDRGVYSVLDLQPPPGETQTGRQQKDTHFYLSAIISFITGRQCCLRTAGDSFTKAENIG